MAGGDNGGKGGRGGGLQAYKIDSKHIKVRNAL